MLLLIASFAGCRYAHGDFEVRVDAVEDPGTVAYVRWTTEQAGNAWIEFGPTRELGSSTPVGSERETEHTVLLAGLPASTQVFWRAFSEVDGATLQSTLQTLDTGPVPRGTPNVDVHGDGEPSLASPGYTLTTSLNAPMLLMYAPGGDMVWWHEGDVDTVVAQARVSRDGRSVLFNAANVDFGTDTSEIVRVGLDGEELERIDTPLGHHDFVELPDGTFAYIAIEVRDWTDGEGEVWEVVGDAIVEVDAAGDLRTVWSSWDTLPVDVDTSDDSDIYPQGLDWTHANSLVYSETDDAYLISLHNLDALVQISRSTGEMLWVLGGEQSDFTLTAGTAFSHQHSPEWTDRGLLLFDNRDVEAGEDSRAAEYAVDVDARTYEEIWAYDAGGRHSSFLLGDADRLANGNTLVSFGNAGVISEVTADGEMAFEFHITAGHIYGFSHHVARFGGPW